MGWVSLASTLALFFAVIATADVVNPGGEENLGRLLVQTPPKVQAGVHRFAVSYRNARVAVGTPSQRFVPGDGCVTVIALDAHGSPISGTDANLSTCGVRILAGKTTEVRLALLKTQYTPPVLPSTGTQTFGPSGKLKGEYGALSLRWSSEGVQPTALRQHLGFEPEAASYRAVPPGKLLVKLPYPTSAKELTFQVSPGTVVDARFQWTTPQAEIPASVVVTAPRRELPSPREGAPQFRLLHCVGTGNDCRSLAGGNSSVVVSEATANHVAFPAPAGTFYRILSFYGSYGFGIWRDFAVTEGGSVTLHRKRIDVADPVITQENGETYTVTGRYQLALQNESGVWGDLGRGQWFTTPSGIDVLSGDYRIRVNMQTKEGAQTKDYFLSLKDEEGRTTVRTEMPEAAFGAADAAFWTCRYQGRSGSPYFSTDQVREVALNRAYSQCQSAGDVPCRSQGCEKH